jgi:hypothetical protein
MNSPTRLGVARALAALLLPAALLLAAPAAHGEPEPQPIATAESGLHRSKAEVEHLERLRIEGTFRNKAPIEHAEQQQRPPATVPGEDPKPADDFPWAITLLSTLGLAAAATGGVVILRRGQRLPRSA